MESKTKTLQEVQTIKNDLNDLLSLGGEIKRQNIFDAEEVSYNNVLPPNVIYDEYGFIKNSDKK